MRRLWQSTMISLARSDTVKRLVQEGPAARLLGRRYVAGKSAADGVARAEELLRHSGIRSSLYYLGEYVDSPALVDENVAAKLEVVEHLGRSNLEVHVSVDPTQIGHCIDQEAGRRNAFRIGEAIAQAAGRRPGFNGIMLDMEDASFVDATIALHNELADAELPTALTLQAYLRRTENDLRAQIRRGGRVRLVKGAFVAGKDIAFATQMEIKANSRRLIDLMLSREARDHGFYPAIATHDDQLQDYAIERAEANGWQAGEYEFEMLLGVRSDVADHMVKRGQRVRLYVPFGCDWWPYAVRRIGENPRNGMLLARSLLGV